MTFVCVKSRIRECWYVLKRNAQRLDENSNPVNVQCSLYKKVVLKKMFNTSNHSSERSMRRESTTHAQRANTSNHSSERSMRSESANIQRGPSTQRSRSARSTSNSSRHSESRTQFKMPEWVHCEKCYVAHNVNPQLILLSCGHIFCLKCLRVDNCNIFVRSQRNER